MTPGSSPLHPGLVPAVPPGAIPEDASPCSPPAAAASSSSETDGCHVRKCAAGHGRHRSRASDSGGEEGGGGTEMDEFLAHNRRLLPNFKNPLHVIDGPEQRYFVGIIDIFTVYGVRKRLEHWWKRLRYPGRSFSTVSPPAYRTRLCEWVKDHSK